MPLEKAAILNTVTEELVPVQFNPEEYTLEAGNQFAEVAVPGAPTPAVQYVRGAGRTMKVELFFDTTADGTDVRRQTRRVTDLLTPDAGTAAPPPLVFAWGGVYFPCVLDKVSQRFARFLPSGEPVRAHLSVTLREYAAVAVDVSVGLFIGPPVVQNLTGNQTLDRVAAAALGDPARWREVAAANGIDNPRTMDGRPTLSAPLRRGG